MIDISNVSQVTERLKTGDTNKLIKEGWTLLSVTGGCTTSDGNPCFLYSLGWKKKEPPTSN